MKAMLKGKSWTSDADAANVDEIMAAIRCMEVRCSRKAAAFYESGFAVWRSSKEGSRCAEAEKQQALTWKYEHQT
jgi:hypothetical protein